LAARVFDNKIVDRVSSLDGIIAQRSELETHQSGDISMKIEIANRKNSEKP
jgi:hypothetical protein